MITRVDYDARNNMLWLVPVAESDDHTEMFNECGVFFHMPSAWRYGETHPDLIALCILLVLYRFVGSRLSIDLRVSDQFRDTCVRMLPFRCDFLANQSHPVPSRVTGRIPGLAYSGGIDSTAALAVLPSTTKVVFLDRQPAPGQERPSLYVVDSSHAACDRLVELGYDVYRIPTNLEYVRKPHGFPLDWANGVPAILLADYLDLSSISWGMVAESVYRIGYECFTDVTKRTIYKRWNHLLQSAGLFLGAPVGGLTEVVTSRFVQKSPLQGIAQSCIRGRSNQPCLNCFKCFRKEMLEKALQGLTMSTDEFERLIRFKGYEKLVFSKPIKHENVFRWICHRLQLSGRSSVWRAFCDRLTIGHTQTEWMERWYPKSIELIPRECRDYTVEVISRLVPPMNGREEKAMEEWNLKPFLETEEMDIAILKLKTLIAINQDIAKQQISDL